MTLASTLSAAEIQAGLDALAEAPGCRLAVLADIEAGLVLRRSAGPGVTQELSDQLAASAASQIGSALAAVVSADAGPVEALSFDSEGDTVVYWETKTPELALVVRFAPGAPRGAASELFDRWRSEAETLA